MSTTWRSLIHTLLRATCVLFVFQGDGSLTGNFPGLLGTHEYICVITLDSSVIPCKNMQQCAPLQTYAHLRKTISWVYSGVKVLLTWWKRTNVLKNTKQGQRTNVIFCVQWPIVKPPVLLEYSTDTQSKWAFPDGLGNNFWMSRYLQVESTFNHTHKIHKAGEEAQLCL